MMASASSPTAAPKESPTGARPSQLALLDVAAPSWRLDRRTREIGRQGVASAREALRRAGETDGDRQRPAEAA